MTRQLDQETIAPVRLAPNQPRQFYRGGKAIAELRSQGPPKDNPVEFGPEDWVGSTTTRFGEEQAGLSVLPDGTLLRDAVANNPIDWLGTEHVDTFGAETTLLVKLLDAGQRLPVHCHPSNQFANVHFHRRYGKTEAWVVIGTQGENPSVYLGFREEVGETQLADWVVNQDAKAMLDALNQVTVQPGDTVFVPSGLPHAIGAGVFIVELQQPTDFSITIEWRGFLSNPQDWHLGLGTHTALKSVDRSGWPESRLSTLFKHTQSDSGQLVTLFEQQADPFFRAERLQGDATVTLDPSFTVFIVLAGSGTLRTEHNNETAICKGDTLVIPHAAGKTTVLPNRGTGLTAIRCQPPAPAGKDVSQGGRA